MEALPKPAAAKPKGPPNWRTRDWAQRLQLASGAAGIYLFFIQYGKLQERIFQFRTASGKRFTEVWFLQLIDALANMLVGAVGRQLQGTTAGLPQQNLLLTGLGQVFSKYCLNASLAAGLSFPVATLTKSAKMLPVMLGALLYGGQQFSGRQLAQAASIVGGTSIVSMVEGGGKDRRNTLLGFALVAGALGFDGTVGGLQKQLQRRCREEGKRLQSYDMMFWTNLYMALAALVAAQFRGELRRGWAICAGHPALRKRFLWLGAYGAMGQACIFYTIANFDTTVCTAITTSRKLISVLLSLAEGGKPGLSRLGWLGLSLAACGIAGEVF